MVLYLFRMLTPYVLGIILVFLTVWYIQHRGIQKEREANLLREVEVYKIESERANRVALELEIKLEDLRKKNDRLRLEVQNENDPIYNHCVLPSSGLLLYNKARQDSPTP